MSRADYIWLVYDRNEQVVAAFTVKHEMLRWIYRHPNPQELATVMRVRDNPGYDEEPRELPLDEIEPAS